jgi:hypothetical protein
MATNAPLYVTNTTTHTDMDIPTVADILQKTYTAHHSLLCLYTSTHSYRKSNETHHQQDSTDVSRGRHTPD